MENKELEKKHVLVKNHVKPNHSGKKPAIPTKPRLSHRIKLNAQINTPTECRAIVVPDSTRTRNHSSKNQSNSSASNAIVPPPSYAVVSNGGFQTKPNQLGLKPTNADRDFHRELCDMMRQSLRVRLILILRSCRIYSPIETTISDKPSYFNCC